MSKSNSPPRPAAPKKVYLFRPADEKYNKEFLTRTISEIDILNTKVLELVNQSAEANTPLSQQMITEMEHYLRVLSMSTVSLHTIAKGYVPMLENYNELAAVKNEADAKAYRERHRIPERPEKSPV